MPHGEITRDRFVQLYKMMNYLGERSKKYLVVNDSARRIPGFEVWFLYNTGNPNPVASLQSHRGDKFFYTEFGGATC